MHDARWPPITGRRMNLPERRSPQAFPIRNASIKAFLARGSRDSVVRGDGEGRPWRDRGRLDGFLKIYNTIAKVV